MTLALWDMETGNLVGAYASEPEALAVVRIAIRDHGPDYVIPLALVREPKRGRSRVLVEGAALGARALAADPAPAAAASHH